MSLQLFGASVILRSRFLNTHFSIYWSVRFDANLSVLPGLTFFLRMLILSAPKVSYIWSTTLPLQCKVQNIAFPVHLSWQDSTMRWKILIVWNRTWGTLMQKLCNLFLFLVSCQFSELLTFVPNKVNSFKRICLELNVILY